MFYFSLYYNVNGVRMARRYWRIPSSSFEVQAIPPSPSASPRDFGGIASTSQDSEGILQYLLAILTPLYQYHISANFPMVIWQIFLKYYVFLHQSLLLCFSAIYRNAKCQRWTQTQNSNYKQGSSLYLL